MSAIALKEAIQHLENKRAVEGKLLKEQFTTTYASLKPVNLVKTFTEAVASPDVISNLLIATIGVTSGLFSKRILAVTSGNLVKKVFGSLLLFGVTKLIARKTGILKSLGRRMVQRAFSKKVAVS